VTCGDPKGICLFRFSREGDYLGFQRRTPALVRPPEEAGLAVNDRELHDFLRDEFGSIPDLIRVKRFAEPAEEVSIDPFPAHLKALATDPKDVPEGERHLRLAELTQWVGQGDFVLNITGSTPAGK
jgi:hypothetical protein